MSAQGNGRAPHLERISAITLFVGDMSRALGFYEALGFALKKGGHDAPFTTLSAGDGCLNLAAADAGGGAGRRASWGRVILYVDDVDAMYARAVGAGLAPQAPPRDAPWGERYFHIQDPDGHELSFARPLDGK
jgi:catechol 2,3-dioxygenase-like lactoylglutathione lyase family enzyme